MYDANRINPKQAAPTFAKENGAVAAFSFRDRLRPRPAARALTPSTAVTAKTPSTRDLVRKEIPPRRTLSSSIPSAPTARTF